MAALSSDQFAETINTQGGASRHGVTGEEPPSKGYMVSEPGHEEMFSGPATAAVVEAHQNAAVAPAARASHEVYQGGWQDQHPDTGEPATFLDVSKRHDVPWHEARGIAESKGQIGSFHLPTFETHYSYRQMPGPQADKAWESKPDRPSNYERDSDAVPELKTTTGELAGKPHTLEDVLRNIATGRMNRRGHGR